MPGQYPSEKTMREKEGAGGMTVREAGRLGGEKVRNLIKKGVRLEEGQMKGKGRQAT